MFLQYTVVCFNTADAYYKGKNLQKLDSEISKPFKVKRENKAVVQISTKCLETMCAFIM